MAAFSMCAIIWALAMLGVLLPGLLRGSQVHGICRHPKSRRYRRLVKRLGDKLSKGFTRQDRYRPHEDEMKNRMKQAEKTANKLKYENDMKKRNDCQTGMNGSIKSSCYNSDPKKYDELRRGFLKEKLHHRHRVDKAAFRDRPEVKEMKNRMKTAASAYAAQQDINKSQNNSTEKFDNSRDGFLKEKLCHRHRVDKDAFLGRPEVKEMKNRMKKAASVSTAHAINKSRNSVGIIYSSVDKFRAQCYARANLKKQNNSAAIGSETTERFNELFDRSLQISSMTNELILLNMMIVMTNMDAY